MIKFPSRCYIAKFHLVGVPSINFIWRVCPANTILPITSLTMQQLTLAGLAIAHKLTLSLEIKIFLLTELEKK